MTARVAAAGLAVVAAVASSCSLRSGPEEGGVGPIVVDDAHPRYGKVGLGSTVRDVERLLGDGNEDAGFAPAHRLPAEVAVPLALPNPAGAEHERPTLRRYEDSAFLLLHDRVYAMMLTGPTVRTGRGVGIGDTIDEVRRRYHAVQCADVAGGESPLRGVKTYPSCQARIAPRRFVFFGGDPVRSITFYSRERVGP
jgi:hypothetical protein